MNEQADAAANGLHPRSGRHGRDACAWFVSNGQDHYAAGCRSLAVTHRDHGLLVLDATAPAAPRALVLHCAITATVGRQRYRLDGGSAAPATTPRSSPRRVPCTCADEGATPRWSWAIDHVRVSLRIWMTWGAPSTYLQFTVDDARTAVAIALAPWIPRRADVRPGIEPIRGGCAIEGTPGERCRLVADAMVFTPTPAARVTLRDLPRREGRVQSAWIPGRFDAELVAGESVALVCTTLRSVEPAELAWRRERARQDAAGAARDATQSTIDE